jgi:hypothetical protein
MGENTFLVCQCFEAEIVGFTRQRAMNLKYLKKYSLAAFGKCEWAITANFYTHPLIGVQYTAIHEASM